MRLNVPFSRKETRLGVIGLHRSLSEMLEINEQWSLLYAKSSGTVLCETSWFPVWLRWKALKNYKLLLYFFFSRECVVSQTIIRINANFSARAT